MINIENLNNKTYAQARKEFLDYWSAHLPARNELIKSPMGSFCDRNHYHCLKLSEMHLINGEVTSTKDEEHCHFNKFHNIRYVFPGEFVLEFDVEHDLAVEACCASVVNLIEKGYHFYVWYAKGMRSPHIRIYDLLPHEHNKLNAEDMKLLKKKFAEMIVPKEYQQYMDKTLFGRHKVCLEFAKHWKYGTHLNLLFEYSPCN